MRQIDLFEDALTLGIHPRGDGAKEQSPPRPPR